MKDFYCECFFWRSLTLVKILRFLRSSPQNHSRWSFSDHLTHYWLHRRLFHHHTAQARKLGTLSALCQQLASLLPRSLLLWASAWDPYRRPRSCNCPWSRTSNQGRLPHRFSAKWDPRKDRCRSPNFARLPHPQRQVWPGRQPLRWTRVGLVIAHDFGSFEKIYATTTQ